MPITRFKQLFQFDHFYPGKKPEKSITANIADDGREDINQRMEEIYGQDLIKLQLLYEKWVMKGDWRLKDEALLLLLAIDPENKSNPSEIEQNKIYNELWSHAMDCVEQGLLKVINHEQPPEEWRVRPVDVYQWSKISRIETPEPLGRLMEFVVNSVKSDKSSVEFDKNRENILGMALAVLAASPERCKNDMGQITVERILKIIEEKSHFWPDNDKPDAPLSGYRDLINKWLTTVNSDY